MAAALKAFLDAQRFRSLENEARRARVFSFLTPNVENVFAELPAHLRDALNGLFSELEERVIKQVLRARTAEEVQAFALDQFTSFIQLWTAMLSALGPWTAERPERMARMTEATRANDPWSDERVQERLGLSSCANFAAALDARLAVAELVLADPGVTTEVSEDDLAPSCLLADLALMCGYYVAIHDQEPVAPIVADALGSLAIEAARHAYVLVGAQRFADAPGESDATAS